MAGYDLAPSNSADIDITFSSDFDWYTGTDLNTEGKFDLVTIALHEIGHGLGFIAFVHYETSTGKGSVFEFSPYAYVKNMSDSEGKLLVDYPPYSEEVGSMFVSNTLYMAGENAFAKNGGKKPKLFAPSKYVPSSSLSHLDEKTYPAGSANSLMTPRFGKGEAVHEISPMLQGIMKDMGWQINEALEEPQPEPEPEPEPITYLPPVDVADPQSGVKYYYYQGSWQQLPDLSQIVAADSGVVTDFGSFSSRLGGTFLLQLEGYFNAPAEGSYTLLFQGADDLYVKIHDQEFLYQGSVAATQDSLLINLQAGMHPFKVFYLRKQEEIAFQHSFRGPDQQDQGVPTQSLYVDAETSTPVAENPEPAAATELQAGLKYAYYEGAWSSMPNFQQLQPQTEGLADDINLSVANRQDQFALRFSGLFNVPQSGKYTFFLNANEGSALYLDDQLILEKGTNSDKREVSVSLQLEQGLHPIQLNYYENTGAENLELYVQLEGYGRRSINQNELFHERPVNASMISLEKQAHVFPNPVKEKLTVAFANLGAEVEVSVFDNMGKPRLHFQQIRSGQRIYLGTLESGIYQLQIKGEHGHTIYKRLIKH
jgi:hypothetical protein